MKVSPSICLLYDYQIHRGRNVLLLYGCYQGRDGKNYEWMCLNDREIFPPINGKEALQPSFTDIDLSGRRKHSNPVIMVWCHHIKEAARWTGASHSPPEWEESWSQSQFQHKGALKQTKKMIYITLINPQLNSIKLVGLHETNTL